MDNVTIAEAEFLLQKAVISQREYKEFLLAKANMIRQTIEKYEARTPLRPGEDEFADCGLQSSPDNPLGETSPIIR